MGNGEGLAAGPEQHGGHGAMAAWQAPSRVERELYEAKNRGDWSAYFDVLARTDLFVADSYTRLQAHPRTVRFTPYWYQQVRAECLPVLTEGMLPAPHPETVFLSQSLGWFADEWRHDDPPWIVINPGTPCETFFPAGPAQRALWKQHAQNASGCGHSHLELRGLDTGGATEGPVAHGLACAALLFVKNGELWNAMAYHGGGYTSERNRLKEWWGVTSREEWQRTQEVLLTAEMISGVWEFALGVRRSLALDFAGPVGVDHWRAVAERVLRRNAAEAEFRITPDGVTKAEPRESSEVEAQVAGVQRLIGRIARYEARFRADGLLAEGKFIRTVEAWDYGRASGMARWGLAARFCTLPEAEHAVLRASRAAQANYRSWEEFSAAYILGRCLHFDEEEFGSWYEDMLTAHRILTTDPASPWLTLPFT
ncbi:DUF1266 domain-containing protein [Streptomyces sp. NA02950]|uniref:DUF1266 domain-containing protein n=1 Tax=Streptomyces sp. NA02950 TaxID=2742137 RepID=UPI0015918496|nr:DUF1266 domain-containing protein [Streptomyces sp. NA02950]QKV96567.1 DUF1266 domain-containing protein [Streptomyces sp. NA02950]